MVRDVFTQDAIVRLVGGMGIGHGELPTSIPSVPKKIRKGLSGRAHDARLILSCPTPIKNVISSMGG